MFEQFPEILTKGDLANLLQCEPASIYEACRSRSQQRQQYPLPFFKLFNGELRFRKSAIISWLDNLSAGAA
jgi:hypothetical protein